MSEDVLLRYVNIDSIVAGVILRGISVLSLMSLFVETYQWTPNGRSSATSMSATILTSSVWQTSWSARAETNAGSLCSVHVKLKAVPDVHTESVPSSSNTDVRTAMVILSPATQISPDGLSVTDTFGVAATPCTSSPLTVIQSSSSPGLVSLCHPDV